MTTKELNERMMRAREEAERDFKEVTSKQDGSFAKDIEAVFVGGKFDGMKISHEMLMGMKNKGFTPRFSAMKEHNPLLVNLDLEDQPIIEGYLSPMFDGGCLRYETQEVYDRLSN